MPKDFQDKFAAARDHLDKLKALVMYFERLEKRKKVNRRDKSHNSNINNQTGGKASRFSNANKHDSSNSKHKHDMKSRGNSTSKPKPEGKLCTFHKTDSHDSADCFVLKKQRQDGKKRVEAKPKKPTNNYPRI